MLSETEAAGVMQSDAAPAMAPTAVVEPADPALCRCGSGLRGVRCCQLDLATIALPMANKHLQPAIERATQAASKGAGETAERLALEILELSPGQVETLWLLSRVRLAQGRAGTAEVLVRRIVAVNPNGVVATQELSLRLLQRGLVQEAIYHARNAVRLAPQDSYSHSLLGMALTEGHQPQTAEFHYLRVLALSGQRDPILLANLAWCLKLQGRMDESRALYEESMAAAPDVLQTLMGFARMEEADRNFPRALELLAKAKVLAPENQSLMLTEAVVLGRLKQHDAALLVLGGIAASRDGGQLGPEEMLEKGRLLDRLGQHDDAFAAFTAGKAVAVEIGGMGYQAEAAQTQAARLRGFFTTARLSTLPRAAIRTGTAQPIFILGFPRSGTTLVEQTLSSHPRINAGDELQTIHELTDAMPRLLTSPLSYPEALAELWMGDRREGLDSLRDYYLQRARQQGVRMDGVDWFTDKMPLNEFHMGLIALVFPEAPLIHVIRHPLDIMVSAISNMFTHGFQCGFALETAARHYALTAELVAHYRAEMTLRYLPVRYEDIVADQENQVRRMLDFVGAEFDPACLAFHENRRYARTASYAQVTEPLYDRSRERWRKYWRHLEPIIPILQPAMDRLGYTVD